MMHALCIVVLAPEAPLDTSAITDRINVVFDPYYENLRVDPYKEYHRNLADAIEFYKTPVALNPDGTYVVDDTFINIVSDYYGNMPLLLGPGQDEEGVYTWTQLNPNGRWDWWEIGGRWKRYFQTTDGAEIDITRKSLITMDQDLNPSALVDLLGVWHGPKRVFEREDYEQLIQPDKVDEYRAIQTEYDEEWLIRFSRLWKNVSPKSVVVAVDYHS